MHTSRDGDGCVGDAGGDDDDDGEGKEKSPSSPDVPGLTGPVPARKNRKKLKKKKKQAAAPPAKQSSPPRVPLSDIFLSREYPRGELQSYTKVQTVAAEERYNARQQPEDASFLQNYRKAAEVHRQTRKWVQDTVSPGQNLRDIAEGIEDSVRALLGHAGLESGDSLKAGMGFPTGLCLNHQVAHYTPNPGQKDVVLRQQDVLKVDFGVHINGWIIDSAFTIAFDPTYDNLWLQSRMRPTQESR